MVSDYLGPTWTGFTAGVTTNPLWIDYFVPHQFLWGMVAMFGITAFWMLVLRKKIPYLAKQATAQIAYQNQPVTQAPVVIQQPQQAAAPISPTNPVVEKPKEATA